MDMLDIIIAKRNGKELSLEQINYFVSGVTTQRIPDYQIAALLMAIVLNGMTKEEITHLTLAMAHSGEVCDLTAIPGRKVDKHSSGGVGDKCTMIVLPIVAALDIPIAKLSGRGLGFTGGTIDKLESIRGFSTDIPITHFVEQIQACGMVLSGQTPELAPADKFLYALRDVTGTVDSIPLIAASIMSKKIAGGADAILLDVTCGQGAFMKDQRSAAALAQTMIQIGQIAHRPVTCVITAMDQPLGKNVGNALEVIEAYETLSGKGPEDLLEICLTLAGEMLKLANPNSDKTSALFREEAQSVLESGKARRIFETFIQAQGGELLSDQSPLYVSMPEKRAVVVAEKDGYISGLNAYMIGQASVNLGAGRKEKADKLDMGAGFSFKKKVGDKVKKGEVIANVYQGTQSFFDQKKLNDASNAIAESITYSLEAVPKPKEVLAILDESSL